RAGIQLEYRPALGVPPGLVVLSRVDAGTTELRTGRGIECILRRPRPAVPRPSREHVPHQGGPLVRLVIAPPAQEATRRAKDLEAELRATLQLPSSQAPR